MSMTPYEALEVVSHVMFGGTKFFDKYQRNEAFTVLRSALEWHTTNEKLPEVGEIVMWRHKSWKRAKEGYLTGGGLLKVWGGSYHKLEGLRWTYLPTPPEG